tara:strand:+ start:70 stop:528 length:459 start_codon:yes stop_codon:yes gene_type:complete
MKERYTIELLKLLEMIQFAILGIIFGYINGQFISQYILIEFNEKNYINDKYDYDDVNLNPLLWFHITFDISVITVTTYYFKKFIKKIPFIFSFLSNKYIPGLKNEDVLGFSLGLGFIYLRLLKNFQSRLSLLTGSQILKDYKRKDYNREDTK